MWVQSSVSSAQAIDHWPRLHDSLTSMQYCTKAMAMDPHLSHYAIVALHDDVRVPLPKVPDFVRLSSTRRVSCHPRPVAQRRAQRGHSHVIRRGGQVWRVNRAMRKQSDSHCELTYVQWPDCKCFCNRVLNADARQCLGRLTTPRCSVQWSPDKRREWVLIQERESWAFPGDSGEDISVRLIHRPTLRCAATWHDIEEHGVRPLPVYSFLPGVCLPFSVPVLLTFNRHTGGGLSGCFLLVSSELLDDSCALLHKLSPPNVLPVEVICIVVTYLLGNRMPFA